MQRQSLALPRRSFALALLGSLGGLTMGSPIADCGLFFRFLRFGGLIILLKGFPVKKFDGASNGGSDEETMPAQGGDD